MCAKDQCGNLCLDFQTHPRNCGACGTVVRPVPLPPPSLARATDPAVQCTSGICHLGQCYTPDPATPVDPTVCVKRDAIVDGGFGVWPAGGGCALTLF